MDLENWDLAAPYGIEVCLYMCAERTALLGERKEE